MLRTANNSIQNTVVGFFMAITIVIQVLFFKFENAGTYTFISIGLATGFYASFKNRVLPGIIIGTILATFFSKLMVGETLFLSFMVALSSSIQILVAMYVFYSLIVKFDCQIPKTLRKAFYYFLSLLFTTIIISILPAIQMSLANNTLYLIDYFHYFGPTFVGLVAVATPILFSNKYDTHFSFTTKIAVRSLMYAVFFTTATLLIFFYTKEKESFVPHGQIFLVLFIVNAYVFNYRMIIYASLVYLGSYNIIVLPNVPPEVASQMLITFNALLFILITSTIFTKELINTISDKNKELNKTNNRLEEMVNSTIDLIKVKDTLDFGDETYVKKYLENIFEISLKLFDKVDYAICALKTVTFADIVAAKGYDMKAVANLKILSKDISWKTGNPVHTHQPEIFLKKVLGELTEFVPDIKETVHFVISIDKFNLGTIRFDILKGSDKTFTENDINNITAFQKLINSYYEMNQLSLRNSSLKDDIVLSLIRTLELYDQYTGGHSEDVANLSKLIAEEIKLSSDDVYDIYWAGIVHDIGKIGINSDIINKPSKLTLSEYQKVKEHSVYGYQILQKSEDLRGIAKLVKHHHEWWNGSGYPDGIKEYKIPLGSQILQIADSISAMTTKRPYTKVKTIDEILAELEMYKGTQFSPKITDVVLKMIKEGKLDYIYNNSFK